MRHFRSSLSVATLPRSMQTSPAEGALVASAGATQAVSTSQLCTLAATVDIAMIASRADRDLHGAAAAVIEPVGRLLEPQVPLPDGTGQRRGREA